MSDFLKKVFSQISSFYMSLSIVKRVAIVGLAMSIFIGIGMLFMWAGDKTFNPLMTNLNPEEAANIIRVLRDRKIPFKVDESGRNIAVPPESVDQLRLELATMGLPQTGTVGYEVFDKQSIGTTSFVQKVNQKRALEGELMRTIAAIKGVKRSRVHLAIPNKSTFVEDQKKATASVVVDLDPGIVLTDKQIYGVQNLISRAVEGMDVSDVVIVDSLGKLLSKNSADPMAVATATQLEFRQAIERETESRIEAMLNRVVGDGRVVARVSAELDFSVVNETQTVFDGDGSAVRSSQKNSATQEGLRPSPSGLAGAKSNLPDQQNPAPAPGIKSNTNQNFEVTNYEVPQTIRKTTKPQGGIKKLSVAVVVDAKRTKIPGVDGKAGTTQIEPWSPEKLKEFEEMVVSAAGVDRKRGDVLDIKSMEFKDEDFEEASRVVAENERKTYTQSLIIYGVIGLTIVLFFFLVIRPFVKWITENTVDSVDTYLPQTIEELEKIQKGSMMAGLDDAVPELQERIDPDKVEGEMLKEKIIALVDTNPHKAAIILRDWLVGGAAKPAGDEKSNGKAASA